MDFNKILNKAKLEESKQTVRLCEERYYEALTDALSLMDESEVFDTLSRMDEKALFGSLGGQVKKMNKQVNNTLNSLVDLQNSVASDLKNGGENPDLQKFYQYVVNLVGQCQAVQKKLNDANFIMKYKTIDNNTGLFGGNKGAGKSSKDINNYTKQVNK